MADSHVRILSEKKLLFRLFRFFTIGGIILSIVEAVRGLLGEGNYLTELIIACALIFFLILAIRFESLHTVIYAIMILFSLSATISIYLTRGGAHGLAPYLFTLGFVVSIMFFRGALRISIVSLIFLTVLWLYYFPFGLVDSGAPIEIQNFEISYLSILLLIALGVFYMKASLISSRDQYEKKTLQLKMQEFRIISETRTVGR